MNFLAKTVSIIALLTLAAPAAYAVDTIDTATKDKITAQLTGQGYDVRKLMIEDNMIEAYAVKNGTTFEIYFNDKLEIVKTIDSSQG